MEVDALAVHIPLRGAVRRESARVSCCQPMVEKLNISLTLYPHVETTSCLVEWCRELIANARMRPGPLRDSARRGRRWEPVDD